jgi:acetyl-CoA C-acetyltransferase
MLDPDDLRRLPCLVGTARRTWHPGSEVPEPLAMWEEVAREAARDAGAGLDPIPRIDELGVVHCQSWAYDDPSLRLAERLGTPGAARHDSILAGTSPQRLLNAAAERMLAGRSQVALVVGGEALATRRRLERAGTTPRWSHPHPTPPELPVDLDVWYLPTEIRHGVLPAWLTFALLEQARWAARGATTGDRDVLAGIMRALDDVAADNPDAWFHDRAGTEELVAPSPSNRMVATPYTKRMTAFMDVDMAAANLLVTKEVADAWGVPEDRRAYLRGWGFARDGMHLGARADLTSSAAMRAATGTALRAAGVSVDDVDTFDLYSCFGSAVQFARDALGLAHDDPRPISVTGGLPYHGGPSSNYMGHALSHLVDRIRSGSCEVGLLTGVGMHLTKHVAAVWSARPGPVRLEQPPTRQGDVGEPLEPDVAVRDAANGPATVLAATVVHASDGSPHHAVAICELPDGTRCYAHSPHADSIDAVLDGSWVDRKADLRDNGDGTNDLRW